MKLTDISVNRSITAIMVFVALLVLGFVSYSKMALDLFPEIEFPVAVVITEYPDVGPKEIESTVTRPLEESLAGINNVDNLTSTSKEGMSMVVVEFTWGTDMSLAVSDMRERIDITKGFLPEDVETPIVLKFDTSMIPIMVLSISGSGDLSYLRNYAEDTLKSLIEQTDGVASAYVSGGQEEEVKVELIKNRMDAYNLSVDRVIQILGVENLNVAGGEIKTPMKKFTLRTQGEFQNLDNIRNVVVDVKNNTPIYLKEVARVYMAPAERNEIVHLNGENGVVMRINKQSDKNTVIVARNVMDRLEKIRKTLPKGMEIVPFFNQAEYIENSIDNVVKNAIQGGLIAILVVFVFLRNIRSALILGLSIPISIIATFIMMYYFDLSLNMMSMGGLAIGVGMLIDNSIVIMENIFRFREKGARPGEAARLGADEMGMAITASTLTTVSVFIPFLFTEGLAGQLFKDMALTITFSLLCSLLVALTLIPMMTSRYITTLHRSYSGRLSFLNVILDWSDNRFKRLENFYVKVINRALDHRKRVIAYTVLAVIVGFLLLPVTGMEFMPEQDEARLTMLAKLPVGTNLDTTEEIMTMVEKRTMKALKDSEYRVVSVRAGYGEGFAAAFGDTADHTGKLEIRLVPVTERERSQQELREVLREELKDIPGVDFNFSFEDNSLLGGGAAISIEVYGYDFEKSAQYTKEIYEAIKPIASLKDIDISREEGLPEKVIRINRDKASKMGLNASQIANMVKNYVAGKVATIYRHEGDEYDVFVRLREKDRETIDDIRQLRVTTPVGVSVPLGNLIKIDTRTGPTSIERKKQERVVYIKCRAEGQDLRSVVSDIQDRIDQIPRPTNFNVMIAGAYEDMQDTFKDLALALLLAVVLIYIIMASQFESFASPFIIMFSVPTLFFGVMVFLFLTGTTFNVVSFMGVLMLSGIVVNNAIVLVDYTNILRARGMQVREAIIEAGRMRLRPIMMTTFTTILALIPMSLGIGEGSEMSAPLARSVIGGMSSSFIFTLVFIPVVYSLFESGKERLERRKEMKALKALKGN